MTATASFSAVCPISGSLLLIDLASEPPRRLKLVNHGGIVAVATVSVHLSLLSTTIQPSTF